MATLSHCLRFLGSRNSVRGRSGRCQDGWLPDSFQWQIRRDAELRHVVAISNHLGRFAESEIAWPNRASDFLHHQTVMRLAVSLCFAGSVAGAKLGSLRIASRHSQLDFSSRAISVNSILPRRLCRTPARSKAPRARVTV